MASNYFTASAIAFTSSATAAVKMAKALNFTSYVLVPVPGTGMFKPVLNIIPFPLTRPISAAPIALTTDFNFGGELSTQLLNPLETQDLVHTLAVYNGTTEPILRTFNTGNTVLVTEVALDPLLTQDGFYIGIGSSITFTTGSTVVSFVKANKQFSSTITFTPSVAATWAFKKGFSSATNLTTGFSGTRFILNKLALSSIGPGSCSFKTCVVSSMAVASRVVPATFGRPVIPAIAPNFMNS